MRIWRSNFSSLSLHKIYSINSKYVKCVRLSSVKCNIGNVEDKKLDYPIDASFEGGIQIQNYIGTPDEENEKIWAFFHIAETLHEFLTLYVKTRRLLERKNRDLASFEDQLL